MIKEVNSQNESPYSKRLEYIENGIVLGYLEYSLIYDRMEIDDIYVSEKKRNKKIGTKLLEYLIEIANKEKVVNITLEVRISNKVARHLYEKFDFKNAAIRKYYYGDEDAILMEKKVK